MTVVFPYIMALGFSFLLNTFTISLLLRLAHKFKWYDSNDFRKTHTGRIPRIGGIGIAISFFLPVFTLPLFLNLFPGEMLFSNRLVILWALILGALIINLTGILDDFRNLRPLYKLFGQIAAALVIIFSGNYFTSFYIPFLNIKIGSAFIGQIVTFIWIIGVTNAVNLIDGMDGFSGSITVVISFIMGTAAVISGNYKEAVILFILCGSIGGFLIYNFPPAKLFMGDSGSLFIGFLLACIPLYAFKGEYSSYALILGISFLIIPVYDTFAAIIRRKMRGLPFQSPDMDHLHHKLLALGFSKIIIIILISLVTIISSSTALLFVIFKTNIFIYLQLFVWTLILILFFLISRANKKRL